jgi:hypothetical protein
VSDSPSALRLGQEDVCDQGSVTLALHAPYLKKGCAMLPSVSHSSMAAD